MNPRLIVRCKEGHPYDRNAHAACPICGAEPVGNVVAPSPSPKPQPTPVPRHFGSNRVIVAVFIVGAVITVAAGGIYFYRSAKQSSVGQPMVVTKPIVEPKTTPSNDAPKPKPSEGEPKPKVTQPVAKADTRPDVGVLAQNLKHPLETDGEAAARVAKFMTVDAASLQQLKRALSPIDPKDVDPLLVSLGPAGADILHPSMLLRAALMNEGVNVAYEAHDFGRARILLSALVSQPPLAPGVIPLSAYKNLAYLLSQDPIEDPALAGHLALVAAKRGYAPAAALLIDRPNIAAAAAIDPATLTSILKMAALQDRNSMAAATQHGIDTKVLDTIRNAFDAALARRDWPAAIRAVQSIGEPQIPAMDARFARTLLFDQDYTRFLDRALVGAVTGSMAFYYDANDTLSYYVEFGLDGVVKDAPNAAVWMMLVLKAAPANDSSWDYTRKRYAKIKQVLSPEQSRALAQIAQQVSAP